MTEQRRELIKLEIQESLTHTKTIESKCNTQLANQAKQIQEL